MIYTSNPKTGDEISRLGFGCMRLPRSDNKIDMEKSTELVKNAVEAGVNYFDTAYIYKGSEQALGTILENTGLREKVKIATKFPVLMCKSGADFDKFFDIQLSRLKTDYIDYYLIHMLCDERTWERLKGYGILEWIDRQKAAGRIKNIGFSYHGGKAEFSKLIDAYSWDFCMIQYNYLDENNQAGKAGLRYAHSKGIQVFIMEPLRGGMLAGRLPPKAKEVFAAADSGRTPAAWGLRWLFNQPEVSMVLSGMAKPSDLKENVDVVNDVKPDSLTPEELTVYDKVVAAISTVVKIPCTGCGYCLPCPVGVDIPTCFSCYNESYSSKRFLGLKRYFMTTGAISASQSGASLCKKCKKCEKHCPQQIEISASLRKVTRRMEPVLLRAGTAIGRKVMKLK